MIDMDIRHPHLPSLAWQLHRGAYVASPGRAFLWRATGLNVVDDMFAILVQVENAGYRQASGET